ncbi:hypothetical protein [Rudanella lutea]|uniref:hypothetical protein n=1 Tax=Rudanella lutea TaxID=451374 RepID=UPI000361E7F3|nr:hypothetical protein [Rudanella lutea]
MKKIVVLCIALFLIGAGVFSAQPDAVHSKKYTYATLSRYQKQLFETFLADEIPAGKQVADVLTNRTSLRTKTRLAEALLFRNQRGDKENAAEILRWILKNQHRDENTRIYGIWKTSIDDDKLDQNWREFIGCDLILIRKNFSHLLPEDLRKEIEVGLIHAAKGALKRNVAPDYTNISIMSAFLMAYVGTEFKLDELRNAGQQKARDIFNLYQKHHTFSEFNSPTYYGVTLIAIALWRELAPSAEMRQMGQTLEREFWHEAATFYHPTLQNMPGPYFRGYGMDMRKYFAIMGIWIAVAVDNEKQAPMPPAKGPKYGEMSNLAPIFALGLSIPKADLAALTRFSGPRYLSRTVPNSYKGDSLKQVTATLTDNWMMGGVWGNRRVWGQIKTGTLHWKTADGDIGWLLVPGDGKTNVRVDKTTMSLYCADPTTTTLTVYIGVPNVQTDAFTDTRWNLPSMPLGVRTALRRLSVERVDSARFEDEWAVSEPCPNVIRVVYEVPTDLNNAMPLLEINCL